MNNNEKLLCKDYKSFDKGSRLQISNCGGLSQRHRAELASGAVHVVGDNTNNGENNPILNAYYLAEHSGIVGQVNNVDLHISRLNDSTLRSTPTLWMSAYNIAHSMNNALGGTEVFEQNAKRMNTLYLNTLLHGSGILNELDEADIETLAFTCPYTGGNAVFRARVLHGMKHWGVHYDDLEICNGQGVYKNGTSKLQEQLNQVANYNPSAQTHTGIMKEEEVFIYPNPATNQITIGCKNAKEIIVYDLIGNVLIKKVLDKTLIENKLDVSLLHNGMYLYKIIKGNKETFNGKLTIE